MSRLRFSFKITPDPPDIVEKIGALRVGVTSFIGGYSLLVGMFLSSTDLVQDVVSVGGWQVVQLGLGGISILATFVSLVLLTRSASSARAKGRLRGNLLLESLQVGWRPALGFFFPAGILIWALVQGEMAGLEVASLPGCDTAVARSGVVVCGSVAEYRSAVVATLRTSIPPLTLTALAGAFLLMGSYRWANADDLRT